MEKPTIRPQSPFFSSGPAKKYPTWSPSLLQDALLGRSHRTSAGVSCIQDVLEKTRGVLKIPSDYKIALLPGSATGAIECALWSFLGARGVDVFSWDVFGRLWVKDTVEELKLPDLRIFDAPNFGTIPDLNAYTGTRDCIFTWNGTTAGVCVPNLLWIPDDRDGLTICDATSVAFCQDLEWKKLDITTFSWQKGLGGEAAHGMMVLSPRALARLQTHTPSWPVPRLFRLVRQKMLINGVFLGETLNTPSMLCVADCRHALQWAESVGGIDGLSQRCLQNFQILKNWIDHSPLVDYMAATPEITSPISVTFTLKESLFPAEQQRVIIQNIAQKLEKEGVAYDIANHSLAPASFRIWCGPTVDASDIAALIPWIEWGLFA